MTRRLLIQVKTKMQKGSFGKIILWLYHYCIAVPKSKLLLIKYYLNRNSETIKKLSTIKFYDDVEVFDFMINKRKSICRFGDGEISWIYKSSRGYFGQENSEELSVRLKEVLLSNCDTVIIAIPNFFDKMIGYSTSRIESRNIHLSQYANKWLRLINTDKKYGDALITRVYNGRFNIDHEYMFAMWKKVWNNRNVVMIEGEGTKFGVGNDLLINAASVERIIGPSENAFSYYDKLLELAHLYNKDQVIFLIALGPTATILAYDLACDGYQAIDIGHLDIEYEWYLQKTEHPVPIKGKYVNEAGGMSNTELCEEVLLKYKNEIKHRCVINQHVNG